MKKPTFLRIARISPDIVDGPGWTDVEVDGYYDSDGKYVPPQYSSHPTLSTRSHIDISM